MFWKLFDRYDQKKVEGIESALHKMHKPLFDARKKAEIRSHLLSAIKNNQTQVAPVSMAILEKEVRKVGLSVKLSGYMKAMIKEKIFGQIERTLGYFWLFRTKFIFKKAVSYALVVLIVAAGAFSFVSQPEIVSAAPATVLHEIEGNVVVLRAGQTIVPQDDFVLYQNDIIETRDGTATIKYFDSSISRLDKGTRLVFSKLLSDEQGLNTSVEFNFDNGQVWSMVFDLFNGSDFNVKMEDSVASVVSSATFSVSGGKDKTEIGVFHNLIDLTTGSDDKAEKSVILKGYKAVLEPGKNVPSRIVRADKQEWAEENIKKDREYIAHVAQEQPMQHLAATTDNLEESLYLSLNDIEKLRVKLNIAEDKFILGEKLLNDGNIDEARQDIAYLRQAILDIKTKADEIRAKDSETAQKLMDLANDKILKYKKALSIVTPDLPLYEAKQAVRGIELMAANNDAQKVTALLSNVSSMLVETQDLVDDNRYENAKENLAESQKIIDTLQEMDLSQNPELLKQVVEKKTDIVKMLTLIENSPTLPEIKKEAGVVKNSSIEGLMDTASQAGIEESKEIVAPAVKEINSLMNTYKSLEAEDETTVSPKIQLFLDSYKHKAASSESSEPSELSD